MEFILRVKSVYTESDILRKDYLTYFRMLEEAEQEQREINARIEAQNRG